MYVTTKHHDDWASLRSLPQYPRLARHERRLLQATGTLLDIDESRELVSEGGVGDQAFLVVAGRATVSRDGHTVASLGPGDVFGEMAILGHQPRNATVTASTPMTVLVLTPAELFTLVEDLPVFASQILGSLGRRSFADRVAS
jgi:CRP-like cAMP-binding protein